MEQFQEKERGCRISAKAVELQPQLADAWFRHGRVLALAGKHREAVVALEQVWLELSPQGGLFAIGACGGVVGGELLGFGGGGLVYWVRLCRKSL